MATRQELIAPFSQPTSKRLLEVYLPPGRHAGFDIGVSGWTGSNRQLYSPDSYRGNGYDGIRFIGAGREATHIVPDLESIRAAHWTILAGPQTGVLEFHNLTIQGMWSRHGKSGTISFDGRGTRDCALHLDNVDLVAENRPDRGTWGVSTYQVDHRWNAVDVYLANLSEHPAYVRGVAKEGVYLNRVKFHGAGAECFKIATRPSEVELVHGTFYAHKVVCQNWKQEWSWRGGGGFVLQGSGLNVVVDRCRFYGRPGASRCLMIDDGGEDHFHGSATGHVFVTRSGLFGEGQPHHTPIMRLGSLAPGEGYEVAKSLTMRHCGVYGKDTKLEVQGVPSVDIAKCNTPRIQSIAGALVDQDLVETRMLVGDLPYDPVSQGVKL